MGLLSWDADRNMYIWSGCISVLLDKLQHGLEQAMLTSSAWALTFRMESANFITQETNSPLKAKLATTRTVTQS